MKKYKKCYIIALKSLTGLSEAGRYYFVRKKEQNSGFQRKAG